MPEEWKHRIEALELRLKASEDDGEETGENIKKVLVAIQGDITDPSTPGITAHLNSIDQRLSEIERRASGWDAARLRLAGFAGVSILIWALVYAFISAKLK